MYLKRIGRTAIRQGDIVTGLFYPRPVFDAPAVCAVARAKGKQPTYLRQDENGFSTALYKVTQGSGLCVVLSQCCQMELHNGKCKALNIILAPLHEVNPKRFEKDRDRFERIRQNQIDEDICTYWFEPPKNAPHPLVAEFSSLFSVPGKDYGGLLESKIAQLSDVERVRFKTKLAVYFGNPTQEERAAGLWPE